MTKAEKSTKARVERAQKVDRDTRRFNQMVPLLKELGFEIETEEIIKRDHARFNLKEPDVARMKEVRNQVTYFKWFEGNYRVVVHTSYNPRTRQFSAAGKGKVWIMATKNYLDRKEVNSIMRTGSIRSFIWRFSSALIFIENRVANRPVDTNLQLMDIRQDHERSEYYSEATGEVRSFYENVPEVALKYVTRRNTEKARWLKIRKSKGVVNFASDLRIPWDYTNPVSAPSEKVA